MNKIINETICIYGYPLYVRGIFSRFKGGKIRVELNNFDEWFVRLLEMDGKIDDDYADIGLPEDWTENEVPAKHFMSACRDDAALAEEVAKVVNELLGHLMNALEEEHNREVGIWVEKLFNPALKAALENSGIIWDMPRAMEEGNKNFFQESYRYPVEVTVSGETFRLDIPAAPRRRF